MYLFIIILALTIIQFRFLRGRGTVITRRHTLIGKITYWVVVALLFVGGIIMVFPLFWLFSTSLRPATELLIMPPDAPARGRGRSPTSRRSSRRRR